MTCLILCDCQTTRKRLDVQPSQRLHSSPAAQRQGGRQVKGIRITVHVLTSFSIRPIGKLSAQRSSVIISGLARISYFIAEKR